MSVDKATVARAANLARIEIDEAALGPMAKELSAILAFAEQLAEVDVSNVAPMTSVTPMTLKRRKDEVTEGDMRDKALANAPDALEGFFTVPKVVE